MRKPLLVPVLCGHSLITSSCAAFHSTSTPVRLQQPTPRPLVNSAIGVTRPSRKRSWRLGATYNEKDKDERDDPRQPMNSQKNGMKNDDLDGFEDDLFDAFLSENDDQDEQFIRQELLRLESLQEFLDELDDDEWGDHPDNIMIDEDDLVTVDDDDEDGSLAELLQILEQHNSDDDPEQVADALRLASPTWSSSSSTTTSDTTSSASGSSSTTTIDAATPGLQSLENALRQGVVPASAGVGDDQLPGDYDFDPLNMSTRDTIGQCQRWLWGGSTTPRPRALILRDYREAEVRHGRLAMLAAVFWPLQEMLDKLLLDDYGPLVFLWLGLRSDSGEETVATLPYFSLLMTAIMLLLGYLDVYSQSVKDNQVGEAFQPADCFWDPLSILEGGSDRMKRNMQERELLNGRVAMLAFAVYTWEEVITGQPLIDVPGNELLLTPAYQVPYVQKWLDNQFSGVQGDLWIVPDDEKKDALQSLMMVLLDHHPLASDHMVGSLF